MRTKYIVIGYKETLDGYLRSKSDRYDYRSKAAALKRVKDLEEDENYIRVELYEQIPTRYDQPSLDLFGKELDF